MDDAEFLYVCCDEPMDPDGPTFWAIRCTLPVGHNDPKWSVGTLHHDENTGLSWGPLSAVDAIVEP